MNGVVWDSRTCCAPSEKTCPLQGLPLLESMSQNPQDSEQQTVLLFWGKSGVQQMKTMMIKGFQTMRKTHNREARLHIFMSREVAKGGMPSAPLKLGDSQSRLGQYRD